MDQLNSLKQAEGKLSIVADRITAYQAKLEDLVFRAQRIATALKNKQKVSDLMFGYELQNFRRDLRHFGQEVSSLPTALSIVETSMAYDPASAQSAEALNRVAHRVQKGLAMLHDHALLAHQHIREADFKMEAWYLCQELDELAQRAQALPSHAGKIILKINTPPDPSTPPASSPASPPQG